MRRKTNNLSSAAISRTVGALLLVAMAGTAVQADGSGTPGKKPGTPPTKKPQPAPRMTPIPKKKLSAPASLPGQPARGTRLVPPRAPLRQGGKVEHLTGGAPLPAPGPRQTGGGAFQQHSFLQSGTQGAVASRTVPLTSLSKTNPSSGYRANSILAPRAPKVVEVNRKGELPGAKKTQDKKKKEAEEKSRGHKLLPGS